MTAVLQTGCLCLSRPGAVASAQLMEEADLLLLCRVPVDVAAAAAALGCWPQPHYHQQPAADAAAAVWALAAGVPPKHTKGACRNTANNIAC